MGDTSLILTAVAAPLAGAIVISLLYARPNLRETVTILTSLVTFGAVALLLPRVEDGVRPAVALIDVIPGLALRFEVEPLGMLFALVASFLWIVTSIYSIGYMRGHHEAHQTRFYVCFAIAISSALGVAFAGNMMTLFVAYEALTLSTYPLVTHHRTPEAIRAGRTYLGLLLSTSIGLQMIAILWTWDAAGTLEFTPGGILAGKIEPAVLPVLLALYVFGIGKAALMPLHRWLPAAMVAPTPVSALLHAVAVVKAGVFTVLKVVVYVFGVENLRVTGSGEWLMYVAGFTILAASTVALTKDNLKARLAYSTVSQLSYVVIAAAVLAPLSVMAAAIHIAAHAFGKITLFFCAGAISVASHKTLVSELGGIGRRMPWTMAAFTIGSLSMIGMPPTAGFLSKWYLLRGAFDTGQSLAIGVVVLSTLLNAGYFLPIVYSAFFGRADANPGHGPAAHGEAPIAILIALAVTSVGTVAMFWLPDIPIDLARDLVGTSQ
jgi:multicomponent Na+:H+ antiporter subunit D